MVAPSYRSIVSKGRQLLLPKGGSWGFFGWHLVSNHDQAVVITEGEYDAMVRVLRPVAMWYDCDLEEEGLTCLCRLRTGSGSGFG